MINSHFEACFGIFRLSQWQTLIEKMSQPELLPQQWSHTGPDRVTEWCCQYEVKREMSFEHDLLILFDYAKRDPYLFVFSLHLVI